MQDKAQEDREKAGRLACMFNSIYKTLKNLNDDLIAKKKKLNQQKKNLKADSSIQFLKSRSDLEAEKVIRQKARKLNEQ